MLAPWVTSMLPTKMFWVKNNTQHKYKTKCVLAFLDHHLLKLYGCTIVYHTISVSYLSIILTLFKCLLYLFNCWFRWKLKYIYNFSTNNRIQTLALINVGSLIHLFMYIYHSRLRVRKCKRLGSGLCLFYRSLSNINNRVNTWDWPQLQLHTISTFNHACHGCNTQFFSEWL